MDEISEASALVDTDANGSCIPRGLLTDIQKSEIISICKTATIMNGKEVGIEGLVSLNVAYQGIATRIEFDVVSGDHIRLILGMNWNHQIRAALRMAWTSLYHNQVPRK